MTGQIRQKHANHGAEAGSPALFTDARKAYDALLDREDVADAVSKLPPQQFCFLVQERGVDDAVELLRHASSEQIQASFDLIGWHKDQIVPAPVFSWLQTLLELGSEKIGSLFEACDHEWVVCLLHPHARVYDATQEDDLPEPQGTPYHTPDRMFFVDILSEEHVVLLTRLLDALYSFDLTLARRVLLGVMWDHGPETEETAYRFHQGRMADMGYLPPDEARAIYRSVDPRTVQIGEGSAPSPEQVWFPAGEQTWLMPASWADGLASEFSLLSQALAQLDMARQRVASQNVLYLINHALAADDIPLVEEAAARAVVRRTLGYLTLGLEFVVHNAAATTTTAQPARAETSVFLAKQALETISIRRLFQAGHGLVMQLVTLAQWLLEGGCAAAVLEGRRYFLLSAQDTAVCESLLRSDRKPLYSLAADTPPGTGTRPFLHLTDLHRVSVVLENAATQTRFLTRALGIRPDILSSALRDTSTPVEGVGYEHIIATLFSQFLLERPPALVLLTPQDAVLLQRWAKQEHAADPTWKQTRNRLERMLWQRIQERALDETEQNQWWTPSVQRWIQEAMQPLLSFLKILAERPAFKKIPQDLLRQSPVLFAR